MTAVAWDAVGGAAALVASAAALLTILYARATVDEAKRAREQGHAQHGEAINEQRRTAEASAAAHNEEMDVRKRALEAELRLQRILQIDRISQLLLELAEVAGEEKINPPPAYAPPAPYRMTRIPAMLTRIAIAVDVLDSLGGPYLNEVGQLAHQGYGFGTDPVSVVSSAIDALRVINSRVQNDPALKISAGEAFGAGADASP